MLRLLTIAVLRATQSKRHAVRFDVLCASSVIFLRALYQLKITLTRPRRLGFHCALSHLRLSRLSLRVAGAHSVFFFLFCLTRPAPQVQQRASRLLCEFFFVQNLSSLLCLREGVGLRWPKAHSAICLRQLLGPQNRLCLCSRSRRMDESQLRA